MRKRIFGESSEKGFVPENYTSAFRNDFPSTAGQFEPTELASAPQPPQCAVAVFNFGMHLLGGYVTSERWAGDNKVQFIKHVEDAGLYAFILQKTAAGLAQRGYKYVVFRNTNAVDDSKFQNEWRAAVDACSEEVAQHDTGECAAFMGKCEELLGPPGGASGPCRRLAFDARGARLVNTMAAGAFATVPEETARKYGPGEAESSEGGVASSRAGGGSMRAASPHENASFFSMRPGGRGFRTFGYLDAERPSGRHPECTPDGRHYFQLEFVLVRLLADALALWEPRGRGCSVQPREGSALV